MGTSGHTVDPADATGVPSPSSTSARGRLHRWMLMLLVLAAGGACFWWWLVESGLTRAETAMVHGDWSAARTRLTRYLRWHPEDAGAHMMLAEALVKDDAETSPDSIQQAIFHLQQIGEGSSLAAQARLQEARLTLLLLRQPARAEKLLQASLVLDPDSLDANLLMWKLLDLTGRHVFSREFFWRVYDLSPVSQRPQRLRDWYLAEFYPDTANEAFYRSFGVQQIGKIPPSVNLLVRFRESEPEATFVHAALAAFYLERGEPESSLELLKELPDLQAGLRDPLVVAVLLEALIDLGEFDRASTCFDQFPAPHAGYLYWRSAGILRHSQGDAAGAIESYEQALTTWPAKFDWGLMMRLSECLRKVGRVDEAETMNARVDHLTREVLTRENTSRLRAGLSDLTDPGIALELRELYLQFGLNEEADAWEQHRQQLLQSSDDSPELPS